jgi:LysR family glycine cleavage system transcriptional activator
MDFSLLPPLAALRAFAAFTATGSVVKAGAALNVSHPAISQQLRALEEHLGLALFDRSAQALRLTPEGQALAAAVQAGLGGIAAVVADLTGAETGRPLMVTTTSSFAAGWLLPRLADFRAGNPDVDLMLDPTPEVKPLGPGGIDIALRYGAGRWPGVSAELILSTPVVVVAAPSLVGEGPVSGLEAVADLPWVQELGTTEAVDFLQRHGLVRKVGGGLTALPGNLMLDAVRTGQGVGVTARAFVEADLASGRLRLLHEDDEREGYYLVTRPGVQRPAARAFATWIRRQRPKI